MQSLDKLIDDLRHRSSEELDHWLDEQEDYAFEQAWAEANAQLPPTTDLRGLRKIFQQLQAATNSHEICTYIIEDLELLRKAEYNQVQTPFINYLRTSYEQGQFPRHWPPQSSTAANKQS